MYNTLNRKKLRCRAGISVNVTCFPMHVFYDEPYRHVFFFCHIVLNKPLTLNITHIVSRTGITKTDKPIVKSTSIFRKNIGVFWHFGGISVIRWTHIVDIFYCSIACDDIARQSLDSLTEMGFFLFTHLNVLFS